MTTFCVKNVIYRYLTVNGFYIIGYIDVLLFSCLLETSNIVSPDSRYVVKE